MRRTVIVGFGVKVAALTACAAKEDDADRAFATVLNAVVGFCRVLVQNRRRPQKRRCTALAGSRSRRGFMHRAVFHSVNACAVYIAERFVDALFRRVDIISGGISTAGAGAAHHRVQIIVAERSDRLLGCQRKQAVVL